MFLEKLLEDPVRLKGLKRGFFIGLAVIAIAEAVVPRLMHAEPADFWFEDLPAWSSVYGLVSCAVIIIVSKLIGKLWLMRRENYYD